MFKRKLTITLLGLSIALGMGTFTSCKDYDDDIDHLQEQVDENGQTLEAKSKELNEALAAVKQELASAQTAAEAAKKAAEDAAANATEAQKQAANAKLLAEEAKTAAAKAKTEAIEEAQKKIDQLKKEMLTKEDLNLALAEVNATLAAVKGDIEGIKAELADVKGDLEGFNGRLDDFVEKKAFEEAMAIQKKTLEAFDVRLEELKGLLGEKALELQAEIAKVAKDVKELQAKVEEQNEALKNDLKQEIEKVSAEVSAVQAELNTLVNLLSKRLTSLVFSPETYINGIEAINFATLQYHPWKELLADGPGTSKVSSINDGMTTASYFANPSSVAKDNIKNLSVLTQDATNTITRAAEEALITATLKEIKSGKLVVNLKKNTSDPFTTTKKGSSKEAFKIMALQAEVELSEAEVEAGVSPYVTSDFVRLAEEPVVPYIHNAEVEDEKDVAHFYAYSDIVDGDPATTQGEFILKELVYTETLDLNKLVEVCIKDGKTRLEPSDYGLAFEFDLVKYNLKDNPEEVTNQQSFAKIDKKGILSSTSRNGKPQNKDAIGREPAIQIVLRNTKNDEVVDVRYFKVKWVAEKISLDVQDLGNIVDDKENPLVQEFVCGKAITDFVGTKDMNDFIYTEIGENGISKEEFHKNYKLDEVVYGSLEDVTEGKEPAIKLGTLEDINADGSTHTHNIGLLITEKELNLTKDELIKGEAVRTVYGRFTRISDNSAAFIFHFNIKITVDKMEFGAGYLQTYWNEGAELVTTNENKSFQVNPALTDDIKYGATKFKDCRIVADILTGYNKANVKPEDLTLDHLVKNADDIQFVFDEGRLSLLGKDWTVSEDGKKLMHKGIVAAQLDDATVQLFENPYPTLTEQGKPTTAAQLLLGKSIPTKIVATHCSGVTLDIDRFLINFISPLAMKLADVEGSFKDLLAGGSKVKVNKLVSIDETFGWKYPVWKDGKEATKGLVQWYAVENVSWDLENARTSLAVKGDNIIITNDPEATEWSKFEDKYQLSKETDEDGNVTVLVFRNNSGAHIQQAFEISVPVYVKTKWAPKLSDASKKSIVIKVEPGDM